ncbi:probable calcium-binding protein CML29 [Rhododendron vialii]|uniref:probable calcium-binding protein CML29 n=1 Tax=Rhododendron vialii TaxID=182163 RepID=UPI00265F256B|nr:probable calcium-binding protein CML29 [Rhododendron vialii]
MAQLGSLSQETETLSHVLRLVQAFRAFDSDNDGSITAAELGGIMGSLGYNSSEQEVKAMMQRGDTNRDGRLSIEEFLDMNTNELGLGSLGAFLGSAFEALTVDFESGEAVTGEDLHGVMREIGVDQLSVEDCQAIVASMDADGDGAVSLEEFRLMLNSFL